MEKKIITKATIIDEVSAAAEISKKDTKEVIEALLSAIIDHVSEGDTVQFIKFGRFYKKTSAARLGRNPQTGEVLQIPAHESLAFKGSIRFDED